VNETIRFEGVKSDFLLAALSKVISSLNPLYRRDIYREMNGYDESLSSAQDWDFHLRIALYGAGIKYAPGVLSATRAVENSVSSDYNKVAVNCGKILLKQEVALQSYAGLSETHRNIIGKLFYEAAIRSMDDDLAERFFQKAFSWNRKFSFFSSSKKLISTFIGKKTIFRIDRKRFVR
jgi:hypothetical protein